MAQTKAHVAATNRFNQKAYDNILLRVRKDSPLNGVAIRAYAKSRGESLNSFLLRAIMETIERDAHLSE